MMRRVLLGMALLLLATAGGTSAAGDRKFSAALSGANELPARETPATGKAQCVLSKDNLELLCRLDVRDIENVTGSHIHLGSATENGPVVAFLYGPVPPGGGPIDGRLATTTITESNLIGDLSGQPLSALIQQIRAGNAYVNVHTNDGLDPVNTGPGDFPGGEIRGQLN